MARRGGGSSIPVAPHPPKSHPAPPKSSGGGHSSGGSTTTRKPTASSASASRGSSSGSKPKTTDPYAYAKAQQKRAEGRANQKYLDQAATMQLQIKALRLALGDKGFKHSLEQKLRNITLNQRIAGADLVRGYQDRVDALGQTASDNEKAADATTYANLANRSRERANALSEATAQGAGESDLLRTQQMALHNWNANQAEANRSYFDTLTSINSSLTDLTTDTRTARINNVTQANADRAQLWQAYHDQRSETLTNLGNALGQQAEYFGLANEQVKSKKTHGRQGGASKASGAAFTQASREAGKAWKDPGVSKSLREWEGKPDFEAQLNNTGMASAVTEITPAKKPEGATLRKWDQ